ncbi:helix-turn-helix-type transcriptional regulator, partial [Amycolatopsis sp. SID8362]|nr:helix-turn-helix-type transcriptional regulator [Amycolatopsis sp. SID8362]NED45545.1 helix-turn-helix-type transcriptional regulator [Amycolatopsis sp. SID8362]
DPVLVVLWSMTPPTADDLLAARVRALGRAVGTAGPGWANLGDRGYATVNDLGAAVELAAAHAEL